MEIYRKNHVVQSEAQVHLVLEALDDFVSKPELGKPFPLAEAGLIKIWNNGDHLEWKWSEKSLQEEEQEKKQKKAKADKLKFYKKPENLEVWKDAKIRPWRNQKLEEWINDITMRPTKYKGLAVEAKELDVKHDELLGWPNSFTAWVSDKEIEAAKPAAPSWITE